MRPDETLAKLRNETRVFETGLPLDQRKRLGQFFSGDKISRLLAHLAIEDDTARILDPMAGTGDLLDAVWEASIQRGIRLSEIHAIEIDSDLARICQQRLGLLASISKVTTQVVSADAFDVASYTLLGSQPYDLVIANPPYIRYQSLKGRRDAIRLGLTRVLSHRLKGQSHKTWKTLASSYSGLADFSVPAWLLCALLVRPGGRLAIVTPTTWLSRDYAQVIRYLMLRAFQLECVVEDTPPGWFPDARISTNLIVARRLNEDEEVVPLTDRKNWITPRWTILDPAAESCTSLIGSVFRGRCPEADFAPWCHGSEPDKHHTIHSRTFFVRNEWSSLQSQVRKTKWYRNLESDPDSTEQLHLKTEPTSCQTNKTPSIPERVQDLLPVEFAFNSIRSLNDNGIRVGQGLRTGCNRFFYVRLIEQLSNDWTKVRTSRVFGERILIVPNTALRPVLHRQTAINAAGHVELSTQALDFRLWVLPEDLPQIAKAKETYRRMGKKPPRPMPNNLAVYVRDIASIPLDHRTNSSVPSLSTVRTYARPRTQSTPPRFWYMLPDFKPRHQPHAFTPRVIQNTPYTYANNNPELLVDANFTTFWSDLPECSPQVIAIILNSVWCRTMMEATGTRMGGGALKLEATHLRQLPLPPLDSATFAELLDLTHRQDPSSQTTADFIILRSFLPTPKTSTEIHALVQALRTRELELRRFRQGTKHFAV